MNTRARKCKLLPIGIDVGTQWLRMAQLGRSPTGQLALCAAGSAELVESCPSNVDERTRAITEMVRYLRRESEFKGNQCIMSLPAELTLVQHIQIDKMPPDQLAGALKWELSSKLPYDVSEAEIRHMVAGDIYADNQPKQEVIAVAARRDVIEAHVDAIHRAKLEVVGVNVEPCAIVECFARLFRRAEDARRAMLFVDIGATSTQVVVSHGPRLAFAKNLPSGGAQFDEAISAALGVPVEEAHRRRTALSQATDDNSEAAVITQAMTAPMATLGQELTNCLRYYESVFANQPVERMVFLGGQAHDKAFCQALAQRMELPAQIGDPLAQVDLAADTMLTSDAKAPASRPDWTVAVGLSLGAAYECGAVRAA